MEGVPEFWRTEIWHPISVHLPLVLLIIATVFKLMELVIKKNGWKLSTAFLLLIGTLGAWGAVYTGSLADGIVSRELCDPTVLKSHENGGYIVAWLFSGASLLTVLDLSKLLKPFQKWLSLAIVLLMLVGSGYLINTGHKGAQLVYQQGAGVYEPSEDCRGFE